MDNIDYKGFLRNIYSQVNTHRDINVQEQLSCGEISIETKQTVKQIRE